MNTPKSILFVCLGNICRSPSAEAVMRNKCTQAQFAMMIDSAGTANYHIGSPPDDRAIQVGKRLGYDLSKLTARQVTADDFGRFELICAMDKDNLTKLQHLQTQFIQQCPHTAVANLQLFDHFSGQAVADPYYGDEMDFLKMFDHIEKVADNWISFWQK